MGHAKDLLIEWQEQEEHLQEDLAEADIALANMYAEGESAAKIRVQENRLKEIQEELDSVRELLGRGGTARKIEALQKSVQLLEGQLEKWRDDVRGTGHTELRSASKILLTFAGAIIGFTVTIGLGIEHPTNRQGDLMETAIGWAFASALVGFIIPISGVIVNLLASFGTPTVHQSAVSKGDPVKLPPRWLLPTLLAVHGLFVVGQAAAWIVSMGHFLPLAFSLA